MDRQVRLIDERERAVVGLWRRGHLCSGTILTYLDWVRRFRAYCEKRGVVQTEQLTLAGAMQFLRAYVGTRLKGRRSARSSCNVACNALHAWACALRGLGIPVPAWREKVEAPHLPPLLDEYCHYRKAHNGVAERTLSRDVKTAFGFLTQ